ncbi:MAG: hypothetical protein AAF528_10815 [Cyanobacteria bacterium P01_C01_bin.121]
MVTSLDKFRTQYPEGSLVAELVSIYDGQYVVRAVASNQNVPLGSGLATSVDVQIAEDKARDRALAVLGIFNETPLPNQNVSPPSRSSVESEEQSTVPLTNTTQAPTDQSTASPTSPTQAPIEEEEEDLGPPIDEVVEVPPTPSDNKVSAAVIALENFNTSAVPVDLSDVIAQTDVELTRLGWTNTQGREYLEKTYGKRSRQQLTDEELMSFLLYLEEQP